MGDCWEHPGARSVARSAIVAAVVGLTLTACGPEMPELTVVEAAPVDEVSGVVVVTTVPPEPGADEAFVEDPSTTSSTEPAPTTEATTPSTTAAPTTTAPPTTAPPPPPATEPPPPAPSGPAEASVAFVNQKRAENGRAALQVDAELTALADAWAHQMASDGNLRHNPDLNSQMPDGFRAWGENVGYAWAANVIDNGWWTSEGHRNNILNAGYDSIGVAFVDDGNGRIWGVQVFGGH